jgi:hypothetical protein
MFAVWAPSTVNLKRLWLPSLTLLYFYDLMLGRFGT